MWEINFAPIKSDSLPTIGTENLGTAVQQMPISKELKTNEHFVSLNNKIGTSIVATPGTRLLYSQFILPKSKRSFDKSLFILEGTIFVMHSGNESTLNCPGTVTKKTCASCGSNYIIQLNVKPKDHDPEKSFDMFWNMSGLLVVYDFYDEGEVSDPSLIGTTYLNGTFDKPGYLLCQRGEDRYIPSAPVITDSKPSDMLSTILGDALASEFITFQDELKLTSFQDLFAS
jgi:hypothetical protein